MKKGVVIGIAIAVIVLLIGGYFVMNSMYKAAYGPEIPTNQTQVDKLFTSNQTPSQTNDSAIINQTSTATPLLYLVEISGYAFNPNLRNIHVGDTVQWTNKDSATHTITSDSGNELDSNSISTNGVYSHTFNTPGTYEYHCGIHTSMKGTVVVS